MDLFCQEDKAQLDALVEALIDPLQSKIFNAVAERPDGVSIREISEQIEEPMRRVRYQVSRLVQSRLIVVARQEHRRGAVLRYYRVEREPIIGSLEAESLKATQLQRIGIAILRRIVAEASAAVRHGTFARGDFHLEARFRNRLDRRGCGEVRKIYERALSEIHQTVKASAERAIAAEEPGIELTASLFIFEPPPQP
jgi:DNA-binding transcriptional ArsR family regulator